MAHRLGLWLRRLIRIANIGGGEVRGNPLAFPRSGPCSAAAANLGYQWLYNRYRQRRMPPSREDLLAAASRLRAEVGKRIVGQEDVIEEILMALPRRRPCAAGRRAGAREDADDPQRQRGDGPRVQAHPVHSRPGAERHHGHRDHGGGHGDGVALLPVRARAGVRQHPPRRRDQPRPAADAGGAARGNAGASRDRGGRDDAADQSHSSFSRRRIRSSRKARIRFPKRSSIDSCSTFASAIPTRTRRSESCARRRAPIPSRSRR